MEGRQATWRTYGGAYAGTAALEHLLAHAAVELPEGLPGSEALLLGIGGIGFSYNLYPGPWGVHLALGFTRPAGSGAFQRDVCRRLGVPVEIEETGNAVLAGRALREQVEAGNPVLVWGSKAALPYLGLREDLAPVTEHLWVVTGFAAERESFRIADLAPGSLELSENEMAVARSALFTAKHRRMTVKEEGTRKGGARNEEARSRLLRSGLPASVSALREPLLPGQGLPGIARWAASLEDGESPRGWPRQLASGPRLFDALTGLFRIVHLETAGALRGLWADFLHDAAEWGRAPALAEVEPRYRDLAVRWRELAVAALPDDVPALAEARRLLSERDRVFRRQGWERQGDSASRLDELDRKLDGLREGMDQALPPSSSRARELLADLAGRIRELHEEEQNAVETLSLALDQMAEEHDG